MQLPHLHTQQATGNRQLGKKSLRALNQPIIVRRGGRATQLTEMDSGNAGFDGVLPIPDPTVSWRTLETQRKHLLNLPYTNLSQMALDLSPQVNKGLWDFVRYGNPGIVVEDSNTRAEDAVNAFYKEIGCYYGNAKNHFDSMWSSIFVFGGLFTELVLNRGATRPIDISVNDALSVRFRLVDHPERGQTHEMGQQTRFGFKSHENNPLVRYIGFDRVGNNPYGRPLIAPSVHASLFLLGLISDLRRMIANQGLSRIDYALEAEEILRLIDRNPDIANDDEATAQFIEGQINNIKSVLSNLDVDQDYVHLSTVSVNYATSPTQTNLNGLDTLVSNLQRDVVNGMKSISGLSNMLDSTTETHITRQLEYYIAAVGSVQEEFGELLSDYANIGNQVQGIRSNTSVKFKKQRAGDRKTIADTEKVQTDTILAKFQAQVISRDEARAEIDALRDELVVA